jgi:integrase
MATNLTPLFIQTRKPTSKRQEIPDSKAPGLFFIVQPSGKKSWAVRLRRPDGRTAKVTLGPCDLGDKKVPPELEKLAAIAAPVQGKALTLAQARIRAIQLNEQRKNGADVILEIKTEQLRKQADKADRAANSFGSIIRQFFAEYKTEKWQERPRRWRDDAITLGLRWPKGANPATEAPEVIPGSLADIWDKKPITAITKFDIEAVIIDARKHGKGPGKARKMYSVLSVLFKWLPLKYGVDVNPVLAVKRPRPPPPRERKLDEAEIRMVWQAADKLDGKIGAMVKLLMLTGARLREIAGMRHAELGGNGVWEVPSTRTKNHLAFMVPLPPTAFDIIAKVLPPANSNNEAGLVFTSNGKTPVSGFGKAKKALDAAMVQPIAKWRFHDLRRTFSTIMNESPEDSGLGIAPHIVEACLNHISGQSKVAGVYNKAKYLSEKRAALLRWSIHVDGIVTGKTSNVTNADFGKSSRKAAKA